MIVIILPLNFYWEEFIIILVPDNGLCGAIFLCLFLNFAKLRCAHFPSYLLFFKCTIFSVVFGLLVLFPKMGQIFVKLTIFIETLSTFFGCVDIAITLCFP